MIDVLQTDVSANAKKKTLSQFSRNHVSSTRRHDPNRIDKFSISLEFLQNLFGGAHIKYKIKTQLFDAKVSNFFMPFTTNFTHKY